MEKANAVQDKTAEASTEKKMSDVKNKHDDSKKDKSSKFDSVRGEFKKIIWPSRKLLIKQTMTVIVVCFIVGLIIFGMDTVFGLSFSTLVRLLNKG